MLNTRRLIWFTALLGSIVLLLGCSIAYAENACGDHVSWEIDMSGTLTITGTGETYEYESQSAPWYSQRNSIHSVVVNAGVESLGSYFFEDCTNLSSIRFEGNQCGLGNCFLCDCPSITELTLPANINSWATPIISGCDNLTVYCKKSASNVFGSLRNGHTKFIVTDSDSDFIIENGCLVGYAGDAQKIVIPAEVTEVGYEACSYLENVEEIIIPNTVIRCSNMAFEYCSNLKTISIPESVIEFGPAVFQGCTALTSITLPQSIKNITSSMFEDCSSLREITLPTSVRTIELFAFSGCSSLSKVFYAGTEEYRKLISVREYNESLISAEWVYGKEEPPAGVNYCGNDVTWVLSNDGVLTLSGYGETYNYESRNAPWYDLRDRIKKIVIEENVTDLGSYLFEDCENLLTLDYKGERGGLSTNFLIDCPNIESVIIPDEINAWGTPIISNCEKLTVYCKKSAYNIFGSLRAGNTNFSVIDADSDYIIEQDILYGYIGNAKRVIIPDGVKEIGYEACSYLTNTEEIVLPNSVEYFSNMAFEHCSKLRKINIPDSVSEFGPAVFEGCTQLSSITLPHAVSRVPSSAFCGCTGLKTIIWPKNVTSVAWFAFSECTSLSTIFYEGSQTDRARINIDEYNEALSDAHWIYDVDLASSLSIPDGVMRIEEQAFCGCNAAKVFINDSCISIGKKAFADCDSLLLIYVPSSVIEIDDSFLDGSDNAVIYCEQNSPIELWALSHNRTVINTGKP